MSNRPIALQAIVEAPGDPSVLSLQHVPLRQIGRGEVLVRHEAIGLNFHDVYVRSGAYATMPYPGTPGIEAAGVVEEVGPGVSGFSPGDRVAYISNAYGAYADRRMILASSLVRLPGAIAAQTAAAILLKGVTAHMLLTRAALLAPGDTVLIHAAAGGVGQVAVQMARHLGLRVLGVVGSEAKAGRALALGCEQVAVRGRDSLQDMVDSATDKAGVRLVLDGVGAQTFEASLAALAPFGHCCVFGQVSGSPPPISVATLAQRSLSVSRPIVFHHVADQARYRASVEALFEMVASGAINVAEPQAFTLGRLPDAHAALEAGKTTGATIILPEI